jgi:hypothetical protein
VSAVLAALPPARNQRVQDLFLLAKHRYTHADTISQAEAARRVVGFHNLADLRQMSLRDTAWVVCHDLMPLAADVLNQRGWTDFLMALGPHPQPQLLASHGDHPDGYYAGLVEAVLQQLGRTRVRQDDTWLMPFEEPDVDPTVAALLTADALDVRRSRGIG